MFHLGNSAYDSESSQALWRAEVYAVLHMDSRGSDVKVNKMPSVSQKSHPRVEARDTDIGYLDT